MGILFCMPHLFYKSVAIGAIILFELSICLRRHVCEYPTAIGLCYRCTKKNSQIKLTRSQKYIVIFGGLDFMIFFKYKFLQFSQFLKLGSLD